MPLPAFKPKKVRIKADENDKVEEGSEDDATVVKALCQRLINMPDALRDATKVSPVAFEKVRSWVECVGLSAVWR